MNAHPVDKARQPFDLPLLPTANGISDGSSPIRKLETKSSLSSEYAVTRAEPAFGFCGDNERMSVKCGLMWQYLRRSRGPFRFEATANMLFNQAGAE